MGIIGWLIIGALAGWIASMITKRNADMNCIENIVVGIVGAVVGGFLYAQLTDTKWTSSFDIVTLLVAIAGAVVVLFIWSAVRGRSRA